LRSRQRAMLCSSASALTTVSARPSCSTIAASRRDVGEAVVVTFTFCQTHGGTTTLNERGPA
jgi:hypothetical protein